MSCNCLSSRKCIHKPRGHFCVVWYPNMAPIFMENFRNPESEDSNDTVVVIFETEEEATDAAWANPISGQWPFVVVELP